MDPLYDEQSLTAEVLFLHSLWHQGPPRPAAAADHRHLHPVPATQFKKARKPRRRKKSTHNKEPNSSPGLPWPVPPPPPPTDAWPAFESKPYPNPQKLSSKQRSELAAKNAHHNALKALAAFFRSNNNNNTNSDSDSDSDSIDSTSDEDDDSIKCGFFDKTFEEDAEMRDYYKKSFAKGEFSCLVCRALGGKNMGKKFKGCMALVQHSITIVNTKRRRAHRAFGEAVCKLLGWDITNLSTIDSWLSNNPKDTLETDSEDNIVKTDNVHAKAVPEIGNGDEGDTICSMRNDAADKRLEGVEASAHGLTNLMFNTKKQEPGKSVE